MKSYSDLAGDGGSDILGQVGAVKRRIARALAPIDVMIAVGSGKGGVGKSTLTHLLAMALSQSGHRPAVLDSDLNGPSQARLAGMKPVIPIPGKDGLVIPRSPSGVGVLSLGWLIPESQDLVFPSVSSGDSFVWRATREFTLMADLLGASEWTPYNVLIIDLPPGAERTFQYAEFFGPQTAFVLVTIPSDLSKGVVRRSIAALGQTRNPLLGYVENMDGYWCSECESVRPLFPRSGEVELDVPLLGRVPFDPLLAQRCDEGLSPDSESSSPVLEAIKDIAQTMIAAAPRRSA